MKFLNTYKSLLAVGVVALTLSSCNMEDHKKDREERSTEKHTEIKKVEKGTDKNGTMHEERTHTDTMRRQAE